MAKSVAKENDNSKIVAILSYLLIGIIWYFVDEKVKGNEFAKFHVKQALVLLIVSLVVSTILTVTIVGIILVPFFNLAVLGLAIYGIVKAAQDEQKALPVIGGWAEKLNF